MADTELNLNDSDGSDIEFTKEERLEFARKKFELLKKKRQAKESKKHIPEPTVQTTPSENVPVSGGDSTAQFEPDPIYHPIVAAESVLPQPGANPAPTSEVTNTDIQVHPVSQAPIHEYNPQPASEPIPEPQFPVHNYNIAQDVSHQLDSLPQVHKYAPAPTSQPLVNEVKPEPQVPLHYDPIPTVEPTVAETVTIARGSISAYVPSDEVITEPSPYESPYNYTPVPETQPEVTPVQPSVNKYKPSPTPAEATPVPKPPTHKYEPTITGTTDIPGSFFQAYEPDFAPAPAPAATEQKEFTSEIPIQVPDTTSLEKEIEELKKTIELQKNTINKLRDENTDLKLSQMDLKDKLAKLSGNTSVRGSPVVPPPAAVTNSPSVYKSETVIPAKPAVTRNDYASTSQQSFSTFPQTGNFRDKLMVWKGWQVDMTNWTTGTSEKVAI
ncbi:hypothetical protein JA1_000541 [Spathaspora sp. JA1]|nr:hypothetical protein JA1_000541 [Spathaspora sp. JA1]